MLRKTQLLLHFSHLKKNVHSVEEKFISICEILGINIMISTLQKTEKK